MTDRRGARIPPIGVKRDKSPQQSPSDSSPEDNPPDRAGDDDESPSRHMKRYSFHMDKDCHDEYVRIAKEHGMFFAEFLRRASKELATQLENDGVNRELTPLIDLLKQSHKNEEAIMELLQKQTEKAERLADRFDQFNSRSAPDAERIADRIEDLEDRDKETWSLTEWANELGLTPKEVELGRTELEKKEAVIRIEPEDPDVGTTRWKFRTRK